MKRKLLLFFAMLTVSIGAWAQGYQIDINNQTWTGVTGSQNVAKIQLNEVGVLSSALTELNSMNYNYQMIYINGLNNEDLTEGDILALGSITCETIDLQDLKAGSAFTFSNSNVKNVILPDGWDKDEVKAVGEALAASSANFGSCLSQDAGFQYKNKENQSATGGAVVAYVNKCNTLYDAMVHTYFSSKPNTKLADGACADNPRFSKLKSLTIMGYPSAGDFSTEGDWDSNGHFVPNYEAFEFSNQGHARLDENGQVQTDRASYVDGTKKRGAAYGCEGLVVLDLRDAIITEEHCADLTLSWTNTLDTEAQQIWIPTTPLLKTIPADFLNIGGIARFREFCIPANIENIRTRAFSSSSHNLVHVWTTGTDDRIVYDNGAWITDGKNDTDPKNDVRHFGMADLDTYDGTTNSTYGTYTFSENIKLIESNAFSTGYRVKDVYCLGIEAPECHVDAFTSVMYNGNNTYDQSAITEGIIDREAYTNNMKDRMYMTMLHYPRESQTPHVQRYTDPTREYNVATGLRDGRGNNIYFPNQSEFGIAYAQGTTGYVWNAWENKRTEWGDMEIASPQGFLDPHSTANQTQANGYWEANTYAKKNDRSFYDVTLDGLNMSTITAPSGLDPYYNTIWEDCQLYPQAKSATSNYIYYRDDNGDYVKDASNANLFRDYAGSADDALDRYSRKQAVVTDEQGNPVFESCTDGDYVEDYEWVEDPTGDYVKETVQDGYASTNVIVDGVTTYYSDAEGTTAVTPQVGAGMFVEDGTANDYSAISTNNSIDSYDAFYTTSDGGQTYTPTNLPFNKTLYVADGTKTKYTATTKLQFGKAYYYDADGNVVDPVVTIPNGGTLYYLDSSDNQYKQTSVFVRGQGNYYIEWSYSQGNYNPINDNYPAVNLDGTYYYEDGIENNYKEDENGYYVRGTTYYNLNNNTYNEYTVSWNDITDAYNGKYYYVSGSHPAYCSAQGEDYDASTTYYSDANGTNVATTIRLNSQYYIPNYVDEYRTAQTGDEGLPHYDKNYLGTYHLATTSDAGEPRFCIKKSDVILDTPITYNVAYDYRGWHQFVLAAYAHNLKTPMEPVRSFITDNDWWTICVPYDLKYDDMILFFGTEAAKNGGKAKIPYLSKLMYVVRDQENEQITLMFSKNLMEYKETMSATNHVHGTIKDTDASGKYSDVEIAQNPVILHAGVPYLIRPNMTAETDGSFNRQFDIFADKKADLYNRLYTAAYLGGSAQMNLIYNGEYTVPAYVVGSGSEGTAESTTITNKDGSEFTYQSGTIKYKGKDTAYKISNDFTYTFVGSYYKSVMPKFCYFLGWDSENNCASFWYNRVEEKDAWNWNNETGIICPNFNTNKAIDPATGLKDPARWILTSDDLANDDFPSGSAGAAKAYTMDFGATNFFDSEATGIEEVVPATTESETINVYNVNGVFMGNSVEGLAKGIYIVNGKKYVVK